MNYQLLIIGSGVVGRSIAVDHLRNGQTVHLADVDRPTLDWATRSIGQQVVIRCSPIRGRFPGDLLCEVLTPGGSDSPRTRASARWLVNESVPEQIDLKIEVLSKVQKGLPDTAILTTNTSTLSINRIADGLPDPSRFLGMHFFMPVPRRPAAEIVTHRDTDPEVLTDVVDHVTRLKKTALMVADSPGFVVNRLLAAYLNTSMWLLCGGVSAATIRQAATRMGMPMSPLALIDEIGPETALQGGRVVWGRWPSRMDPSPLLAGIVKHNRRVQRSAILAGEDRLSEPVASLVNRYRHDNFPSPELIGVDAVAELWSAVMAVDAEAILADRVADAATINAAVSGGLGWTGSDWLSRVRTVRRERLGDLGERFGRCKSLGV